MPSQSQSGKNTDDIKDESIEYSIDMSKANLVEVDSFAAGMASAVVPVIVRRRKHYVTNVGSAFCIAVLASGEAIYVTAKHNIDDLYPVNPENELMIVLPDSIDKDGKKRLSALPVQQVTMQKEHTDIALLVVNYAKSELKISPNGKAFMMTFEEPEVGELTIGLGYAHQQSRENHENEVTKISYEFKASQGTVHEIYPKGRDSTKNYPLLQTDAEYMSSMSGGPVLNRQGKVIGLISAGFITDEPPIGYVALIPLVAELGLILRNNLGEQEEFDFVRLLKDRVFAEPKGRFNINRDANNVSLEYLGDESAINDHGNQTL